MIWPQKLNSKLFSICIIGILFISIGYLGESFSGTSAYLKGEARIITNHLNSQRNSTQKFTNQLKMIIGDESEGISEEFYILSNQLDDNIHSLLFDHSNLIGWSSSQVSFPDIYPESINTDPKLVQLTNGWYFREFENLNDTLAVINLIQIKEEYAYENRFLSPKYKYPINKEIRINLHQGEPIKDLNKNTLFYIWSPAEDIIMNSRLVVFEIALLIGTLLLLACLRYWLRGKRWKYNFQPVVISIVIVSILFLLARFSIFPQHLRQISLFSPFAFAYSFFLASIGDILLFSTAAGYCALIFWDQSKQSSTSKANQNQSNQLFCFVMVGSYFFLFIFFLSTLVENSTLSFRFATEFTFSIFNALGFVSIIIMFYAFTCVIVATNRVMKKITGLKKIIYITIPTSILYLLFNEIHKQLWIPHLLFLTALLITCLLVKFKYFKRYQFYYLIILAAQGALITNYTFFHLDKLRDKETQELLCDNLIYERDGATELFISETETELLTDTILANYLIPPYDVLSDYIGKNYLQTGSLRNYDYQITICSQQDKLHLENNDNVVPCYDFFREMMLTDGVMIPKTNFYFLDRLDGLKSYVGSVDLLDSDNNLIYIFIELSSRLVSEGSGYPELLLDEKINRSKITEGFSYAKYHNGYMVDRKGNFAYPIKLDSYPQCPPNGKIQFETDGSYHVLSHIDKENYIIVSRKCPTLGTRLLSFPYSFIIFYIIGIVFLLPPYIFQQKTDLKLDLKHRIQYTMIIFELVTIGLIGIGIIYYNTQQYQTKQAEELDDKVRTIKASLESKMFEQARVDDRLLEYFNFEFVRLSEIFHTDIHLFSEKGDLIATSRKEVFEKGLIGNKMNPKAFNSLITNNNVKFKHQEKIGKLSFYSVYEPLVNYRGDIIGYLNIPYFSKPDDLLKEISSFVVTLINIFLIFAICTFFIALFISKRITSPLSVLEQRMRSIEFGKSNEKIELEGEDEIGRLVIAYNHKVEELLESANKLARSERESAWREMARQVAHEIKNPLTPMKLSIQYLQMAHEQKRNNFEEYFEQVTQTLIEQIENLSKIASSFSNFAKISKANRERISIFEKIFEIKTLMSNEGRISIYNTDLDPVYIYVDKEHLSRILINLVKNGQQASIKNKSHIEISVQLEKQNCIIAIKDNGGGIPEEVADRLFTPYFTTKNSGTGLGLAITKSLVENGQGQIWFESRKEIGTSFFVKLPLFLEEY